MPPRAVDQVSTFLTAWGGVLAHNPEAIRLRDLLEQEDKVTQATLKELTSLVHSQSEGLERLQAEVKRLNGLLREIDVLTPEKLRQIADLMESRLRESQ